MSSCCNTDELRVRDVSTLGLTSIGLWSPCIRSPSNENLKVFGCLLNFFCEAYEILGVVFVFASSLTSVRAKTFENKVVLETLKVSAAADLCQHAYRVRVQLNTLTLPFMIDMKCNLRFVLDWWSQRLTCELRLALFNFCEHRSLLRRQG